MYALPIDKGTYIYVGQAKIRLLHVMKKDIS
jgi:hypothetical protein